MNCNRCNMFFRFKSHLDRHLKRKIPCKNIFICDICNKEFRDGFNLNKHKNRKTSCTTQTINNNTTNNTINNITNNIIINNINMTPDQQIFYDYFFSKSGNMNTLNFSDKIIQELNNTFSSSSEKYFNKNPIEYIGDFKKEIDGDIGCKHYIYKLISIICINNEHPENYIIIYDNYREKLLIKEDNNNLKELDKVILGLLYNILKNLYEHENIKESLKQIYKIYIDNYEKDRFLAQDPDNFIRAYSDDIYKELCKLEDIVVQKIKDINNNIRHKKKFSNPGYTYTIT